MLFKHKWLLLAAGLAGCTVGPDYHKVAPIVPERWQVETKTALKHGSAGDLKAWWKSFRDPQLDRLMERALAGNLDIKIALTRIEQARAERRGARAELFPAVSAATGVQRQSNPFPGLAHGIKYNMFELGFDALWEVDLFDRQQRRLEAVSAGLDAAGEQYRQTLVTLSAELARSYIDYRSLQNQLRITRSNLESQQHTLTLTEKLFNEGVSARHDVVRARAKTETTASQIPALEANMTAALRQLEVLVGQQPGTLAIVLDFPAGRNRY